MPYVPNPADPTQPLGSVDASTADDEFRALKAYIQGLVLTAGMFSPVRQCANDGVVDASGNPAFLVAAGAGGLALDLKATGRPLVANFAGGSTGTGINDRNGTYTADAVNIVTGLAANNTNFIFADYVSAGVWTWQSGLVPPQYGKVFDSTKQELLRFAGVDASTSILSDYGNTWAAVGNAQIDTAVQIDGLNTLLLDGTGDYIESTSFTSLGGGSWSLECKIRWNTLPIAGQTQILLNFGQNATNFGLFLGLNNTAGTIKLTYNLSSNGTSADIASGTLGTSTVWATGTTYHIAITYDALAGKYFVYKDGVQDLTTTSALRICGLVRSRIGSSVDGTSNQLNSAIAGFRFLPYCKYPNGTAFAAPNISTFAVEGDFFDIQAVKMYSATAASIVAGVAPGLTNKYRCYFGEADTSGAVPIAVRSYAFNGKYVSADIAAPPGAGTTNFAHNLGVAPSQWTVFIRNYITEQGYSPGDVVSFGVGDNASNSMSTSVSKLNMTYSQSAVGIGGLAVNNKSTGARASLTSANWKMFVTAQRGF